MSGRRKVKTEFSTVEDRLEIVLNELMRQTQEFEAWFAKLSDHDQMNFKALINLPTAAGVIERMPEGQYKEMAKLAMAINQMKGN